MQKHVELKSGDLILRGMLHIPDKVKGKFPGVVIFHGFTGNKMEPHFIFVKLSRALEKEGIASVRFDFGGSGESDGSFQDMTPESELSDAKVILDYMRGLDFIDKEMVGICGLSMGGYIGGILAGDNKDLVKSLCLWSPAGNIKEIFKSYMVNGNEIGQNLFDTGGLVLNSAAYYEANSINHIERTSVFDKETCIIHGTGDQSVPYKYGLEYRDAMKNVEFYTIEGADHTYNKVEWERKVLDTTVSFFKSTL